MRNIRRTVALTPKATLIWTAAGAIAMSVAIIVVEHDIVGGLAFGIPVGAFCGFIAHVFYEQTIRGSYTILGKRRLPADDSESDR